MDESLEVVLGRLEGAQLEVEVEVARIGSASSCQLVHMGYLVVGVACRPGEVERPEIEVPVAENIVALQVQGRIC